LHDAANSAAASGAPRDQALKLSPEFIMHLEKRRGR
jgi:hypothetical protein